MSDAPQKEVFGHPCGLFVLFFAEMWERFSYYGMRALLVFYMIKGFMGYGDSKAYTVYGAYTALVYMTPLFGGMLADRLLGARRAVVLGGLLMSLGHLIMTVQTEWTFFTALALIICGNGCFKPNISTMVGELYSPASRKRDGGFTIFYIGINLGAAMSPLLCGYVGETYGWHYGFGLATIGMMTGLAVFVMPTLVTQLMVMSAAVGAAVALFAFRPDNVFSIGLNILVAFALLSAAITAWVALNRAGLPSEVGQPPDRERLAKPMFGLLRTEFVVYLGVLAVVPVFILFVSGFSVVTADHEGVTLISKDFIERFTADGSDIKAAIAVVLEEISKPAGLILALSGLAAIVYLGGQLFKLGRIARHRMLVALVLTFFSMLFWAFFEQAGSSINNFTDRNVDRVSGFRVITEEEVGQTITLQPTQEQLGYHNGSELFTMDVLNEYRKKNKDGVDGKPDFTIEWTVAPDNVGMEVADRKDEVPASTFQAVNAVFIMIFGLLFTSLWAFLGRMRMEPSTPVKFALGLIQLGLGFVALWYGAESANDRGMVFVGWLLLGYLLHTTGELCLSPVGLSMITRLSPAQLVSTMMGNWFLATAFSQYLAGIIAQFTNVDEGGDKGGNGVPIPAETVHVYGGVFGKVAIAAIVCGVICLLLSPLLKYWMHEQAEEDAEQDSDAFAES